MPSARELDAGTPSWGAVSGAESVSTVLQLGVAVLAAAGAATESPGERVIPGHVLSTRSTWPIVPRVRVLIAIACSAALALVVVATATASPLRQECDPYCPISTVSFTSVVSRNDYATLKVNVRPRARCTITVVYSTGPSAAGLRAKIGGLITWRWKVRSNTKLGRWPVIVDCGRSGSARFTLRVVR
jgi:hypothetical protein